MSINRYDPQGTMYADPDGEWVSIIDHFKALAAVREEGRREGIEEAAREVYNFILREKKEDMTPSEVRQIVEHTLTESRHV